VGEPLWVVGTLIAVVLFYTQKLTDDVFFIFLGAVCTAIAAQWFRYETKTQDALRNALEASSLTFSTCFLLPMYVSEEARLFGAVFLYILAIERYMAVYWCAGLVACTRFVLQRYALQYELHFAVALTSSLLVLTAIARLIKTVRS
jgi:membrane protein implicated in regulation of membrane protease activity